MITAGNSDVQYAHLVEFGTRARMLSSARQAAGLWEVRERIPEANRLVGALASHDVALPLSEVARFIAECGAWIGDSTDMRLNFFGHLGGWQPALQPVPALVV